MKPQFYSKIYVDHAPGFQSVALGAWIPVGSFHDQSFGQHQGIAHFIEHLLFKGTKTRSAEDIAKAIETVGGDFNAFTTREYTCLHLLVLKKDLALAIEILCDVLLQLQFKNKEIENERQVVLQEIAMVRENPEEWLYDVFLETAFGKKSCFHPILGTKRSIGSIQRKTLERFFTRFYSPKHITFVVSGDVESRAVQAHFKKFWTPTQAKNSKKVETASAVGVLPGFKSMGKTIQTSLEQTHLLLGFMAPGPISNDYPAAVALQQHLGGNMGSVLFQEIREKRGLAYQVYAALDAFREQSILYFYCAVHPKNVAQTMRILEKEISRSQQKKLSLKEVKAMRDSLKASLFMNLDSVENRMLEVMKSLFYYNKILSIEERIQRIDSITPDRIQTAAKKYLNWSSKAVCSIGPKC